MSTINVLLADDHVILRKGVIEILETASDIKVVAEASDGAVALNLVQDKSLNLSIAVIDLNMPEIHGLDLLKQIRSIKPDLPVLVLSMYPEDQYARRVIKNGGAGYLTKESAPDDLIKAIRRIIQGGRYISPEVADILAFDFQHDYEGELHERLSDREYEVFVMISSGKSSSEIAEELNLSVKTISTNRSRILEKMQMKNNAQLTHYAIKRGLVM
jgi:DNA-binding NarL/FixJ family response regulator